MEIMIEGFSMSVTEYEIKRLFRRHGSVKQVKKEKVRNRAVVTMPYRDQGEKAIKELDGTEFFGRVIRVTSFYSPGKGSKDKLQRQK